MNADLHLVRYATDGSKSIVCTTVHRRRDMRRQPSSTFQYFPCHSRACSTMHGTTSYFVSTGSSISTWFGELSFGPIRSTSCARESNVSRNWKIKKNVFVYKWSWIACACATCAPRNVPMCCSTHTHILQIGSSFNIFRKINSQWFANQQQHHRQHSNKKNEKPPNREQRKSSQGEHHVMVLDIILRDSMCSLPSSLSSVARFPFKWLHVCSRHSWYRSHCS